MIKRTIKRVILACETKLACSTTNRSLHLTIFTRLGMCAPRSLIASGNASRARRLVEFINTQPINVRQLAFGTISRASDYNPAVLDAALDDPTEGSSAGRTPALGGNAGEAEPPTLPFPAATAVADFCFPPACPRWSLVRVETNRGQS